MFIIGITLSVFGYAVAYYGIGMAKQYHDSSGHADITGIPLAVLLGLKSPQEASVDPTNPAAIARPPFKGTGSLPNSVTPSTAAPTPATGSGGKVVQA